MTKLKTAIAAGAALMVMGTVSLTVVAAAAHLTLPGIVAELTGGTAQDVTKEIVTKVNADSMITGKKISQLPQTCGETEYCGQYQQTGVHNPNCVYNSENFNGYWKEGDYNRNCDFGNRSNHNHGHGHGNGHHGGRG